MKELQERIMKEGRILPGNILKVDSFLNHMVDPELMGKIGKEFAGYFKDRGITKVLTLEASGITSALFTAKELGVPMIFAKKAGSSNIGKDVYHATVHSFTYDRDFEICVFKDYLTEHDTVLIIDDFLAEGSACFGMADLCRQASAKIAGIGVCIEKGFENGGKKLRDQGYDVLSLAIVDAMSQEEITFRTQPEQDQNPR